MTGTAAALLAMSAAHAADMPAYRPPVVIPPPPPAPDCCEGWYLRGDIGMTNQQVKSIDNALFATSSGLTFLDQPGFSSGILAGLGLGYQFNNWFRADLTGEYRGKADFHALDRYGSGAAPTGGTNEYTGTKSEWLFLMNAYLDLGTWWCITPFIGAGIGTSRNTIDHFRDVNVPNLGVAYGGSASQWEFAWALHAGLSYKVTNSFTVEVAYRYLNLGDAQSGDLITYLGTNSVNNPMIFKDITSHDFKVGLRFACCEFDTYRPQTQVLYTPPPPQVYAPPAPVAAPPAQVYAPPAQVYAPPPTYTPPPPAYPQQQTYPQPPLMRKG
jgi:opacity protein-like surface antigen